MPDTRILPGGLLPARGPEIERAVNAGELTATLGAEAILEAFGLATS